MRTRRFIGLLALYGAACGCVELAFPFDEVTPVQRSCPDPTERGCGVVAIPGGTFTLGEGPPALDAAPVQPMITVSDFALDAYEVTAARFQRYWAAGHPAPAGRVVYPGGTQSWEGAVTAPTAPGMACTWGVAGLEAHPINCVTWLTAQAFCAWEGGRLPTEAEWEWAARGPEGRTYPWGNDAPAVQLCWGGVDTRTGTCVVGSFPGGRTPQGVFDLAGNVYEWLADRSALYSAPTCWGGVPRRNPLCDDSTFAQRRGRGGSWALGDPVSLRSASRFDESPTHGDHELGFRCARSR